MFTDARGKGGGERIISLEISESSIPKTPAGS